LDLGLLFQTFVEISFQIVFGHLVDKVEELLDHFVHIQVAIFGKPEFEGQNSVHQKLLGNITIETIN